MNYALKRGSILKKISKDLSNSVGIQQPNTQMPTNYNLINISTNQNLNYESEAEQLLSQYMQVNFANHIINELNNDDPQYPKEIVLNWSNYQPILESLRGSNVNINKILDLLLDKLKENVIKKTKLESITLKPNATDNDILGYFFENGRIKRDLPDKPEIIKKILCVFMGLDNYNISDRVLFEKITKLDNKDIEKNINYYILTINAKVEI